MPNGRMIAAVVPSGTVRQCPTNRRQGTTTFRHLRAWKASQGRTGSSRLIVDVQILCFAARCGYIGGAERSIRILDA